MAFGFARVLWATLILLAAAGWAEVICCTAQHDRPNRGQRTFRSRISGVQMAVVEGGPRLGDLEAGPWRRRCRRSSPSCQGVSPAR